MKRHVLALLSILFCAVFSPAPAFQCGSDRLHVKTAQDRTINFFFKDHRISSRKLIGFQETTIAELHRFQWPFPGYKKAPGEAEAVRSWSKAEYQIWVVTANLVERRNEDDRDYHLVLESRGRTLVAEIPHPDCVRGTPEPLRSLIIKARRDFDNWWAKKPRGSINQKVVVAGLGMFDALEHAHGTSPNGIELHPVVAIEFK